MTNDSVWIPRPRQADDDGVNQYLQELVEVVKISMKEGGHDYTQIFALFREGLEEVLRSRGVAASDLIYAFFCCIEMTTEVRKAFQFESVLTSSAATIDPKAKGGTPGEPAPLDITTLPARIVMDIQHHLKRQEKEGALAYSQAALQELQKTIPFRVAVKHNFALRRECDLFGSLYHRERMICDQFHMTLCPVDAYFKAKVLPEERLNQIQSPAEVPTNGDVLIAWVQPSPHFAGGVSGSTCGFVAFVCPLPGTSDEPGPGPVVARCNQVLLSELRQLRDGLYVDLEHCLPAATVSTDYLANRLRATARVIRGGTQAIQTGTAAAFGDSSATDKLDAGLESALQELLRTLAGGDESEGIPEILEAERVRILLRSIIKLLDRTSGSARVAHQDLSQFLRELLAPLALRAK